MLNISVNNVAFETKDDCNLDQLIILTGFADQAFAIAVNGEFVPKSQYSSTVLQPSDAVDIIKPIGGG